VISSCVCFQLAQVNDDIEPDESDVMSQLQWTNVDNKPEFVIGDDVSNWALRLSDNFIGYGILVAIDMNI